MALSLISTPFETKDDYTGRWLAANNPIYFVYEYTGGTIPADYYMTVEISYNSSVIYTGEYYADALQRFYVGDLSEILRSLLVLETTFDYLTINAIEPRIFAGYNIEFWGGSGKEEQPNPADYDFYVIHAAKQIGDDYGCCMVDYEIIAGLSAWDGKFLTLFDSPTYYNTFCIDIIWSITTVGGMLLKEKIIKYNNDESENSYALTIHSDAVNHIKLNGGYSDDTKEVHIWLEDINGNIHTEEKVIKINNTTYPNTLYVRWINRLGGVESWLFKINQKKNVRVSDILLTNTYIQSIKTARGSHSSTGNMIAEKYTIGADNLTLNEWEVLSKQLGGSLMCYVLVGTKWMEAIVEAGEYQTNTEQSKHSIELSIVMPQIQTQRK